MTKYRMAQLSGLLNLFGALLVFLSFQATSTDLLLVRASSGQTAFCVGKNAMLVLDPGGGIDIGAKCPQGADTKPTAVVNTDAPWLGFVGWGILALGFLLQIFSIEKPMLSADDLKILRKARKIIDSKL
jgi:hypothetical protein